MPRVRPGRVRSKRNNRREPLLLSKMNPQHFNVRDGEVRTIVCPDCTSWRRLMGEKTLKIREHCESDKVLEGQEHVRCDGSNQVVIIDIDIQHWRAVQRRQERRLRDAMHAHQRRAAQQHYKPIPEPPRPIHQMSAPPVPGVEAAHRALKAHCARCEECTSTYCPVGMGLVGVYLRRLRSRTEQWEAASRSATRADKQRAQRPSGNRPADAPQVPLDPLSFPVSSAPAAKFARRAYADHQTRCSVCTSDQQCLDAQRLERALKRAAAAVA